jgi:uracil-DNA glycosylase
VNGDLFASPASACRLMRWEPAAWPVAEGWQALVDGFLASEAGQSLAAFVSARIAAGATVYPPVPFRMLALTPLAQVKVVIVGQDPYHGPGQAEGLAFSVPDGVAVPPSLRNILKEVRRSAGSDADVPGPGRGASGSLRAWAEQGVLLLNTCLTVEAGQPASHAKRGWELLTTALLRACSDAPGGRVFMLWGAHAQALQPVIDRGRHLVLMANHPSPLSATRGPVPFMGCGHFVQANEWLAKHFAQEVDWIGNRHKTMA